MDRRNTLHELNDRTEQREPKDKLQRSTRRIGQPRQQAQGNERGDVLDFVRRMAGKFRRMRQNRHDKRENGSDPEDHAQRAQPSRHNRAAFRGVYPRSPKPAGGWLVRGGALPWEIRLGRFFTMMMLRAGSGRRVVLRMQFSKPTQSTR